MFSDMVWGRGARGVERMGFEGKGSDWERWMR